jgi:predicted TPR repeat methyltransferase
MLAVEEGYRLWSASYDDELNPIAALERRVLRERLGPMAGYRFLDIATGTGYWMEYAQSHGARAFGLDLSAEMLARAAEKRGLCGRVVRAGMEALPFQTGAADLAVCSLALGYIRGIGDLFRELARVARTVVVSDLHEYAVAAGWRRAFRIGGRHYEIEQFLHTRDELDSAAQAAGLLLRWRVESRLGEPEREIFEHLGRKDAFAVASRVPAILSTCWTCQ